MAFSVGNLNYSDFAVPGSVSVLTGPCDGKEGERVHTPSHGSDAEPSETEPVSEENMGASGRHRANTVSLLSQR